MKKLIFVLVCTILLTSCTYMQKNNDLSFVQEINPTQTPANTPQKIYIPTSELSNTVIEWGIKKNEGVAPDVSPFAKQNFKYYNSYYIGDTSSKVLYLTFDEGYENGYTLQILDVLKANNVPTCFFITGPYLQKETDLVKRMVNEGHDVGNHTVRHPSMPSVTDDIKLEKELTDLDGMFKNLTGKNMQFVRPPKGEFSERTLAITSNLGYKSIFWSFAYVDWNINSQKGADYAYKEVMKYLHSGSIILLHAVSKDNADALDAIIKEAIKQGYTFKSLRELP